MFPRRSSSTRVVSALIVLAVAVSSCGISRSTTESGGATDGATGAPTSAPTTSSTSTVPATTPTTTSSTTSTTTSSPTTSTTSTTTSTTTTEPLPPNPALTATIAAFDALAATNDAVSLTVLRNGTPLLQRAAGSTMAGDPATSDSPMVVASVSKLLTATMIGRLAADDRLDLSAPVPWATMWLAPHPGWADVTVRELLQHTSGMPVVRRSWFDEPGTCADHLPVLLAEPPMPHRGEWTYSNGNYCTLGLLVQAITGRPFADAADHLLMQPLGVDGFHLTTDGASPDDVAYRLGLARLSRLGGAGSFVVSTDDVAAVLDAATAEERRAMTWPGVMIDQYGWGHTGTVDGAKSCAWVLDDERTVLVATIAGDRPGTGGGLCDLLVPALGADLGTPRGEPVRTPR